MTRIMVFGASTTYGAWDRESGWVARLRRFLDEKNLSEPGFHCLIYNLGVSGDTGEDLLERFESETKQRMKEKEENIFVFAIGGNDAQFVHSKNDMRVSPEKFRENVQKLIDLAKKISSKIVFVGLVPVDESKTTPIPWDTDKTYKNEYVQKYNEIVKSVCRENNIPFIEIYEKLIKTDYKKLLEDGVHPNSRGHKKIFDIVRGSLTGSKII